MSRVALAASLLLTLLVYWVGLAGPLIFDDEQNLAPINDWLQGLTTWKSVAFGNTSGLFGRPVSMLSFVANVQLLGPDIRGLKLGNLLIHLVNGALVFALFGRLMAAGGLTRNPSSPLRWLPWLGATLWLLHPLLVSTVLYVVQRMAMLSALFTLLTLLAYVSGRLSLVARPRHAYFLLFFAAPLCTALALLSKENGLLAPALCGVLELVVFAPARGQRRPLFSRVFIAVTLVLPALVMIALTALQAPLIVGGYANRPFTLIERMLTEPRVLWDYVATFVAPSGARMGLYHDDYVISTGLFAPVTTLIAIVAGVALLAIAWRARRVIPGFALGVGFFLVGHALESTVFPLLIYFEHRNYLPSVGLMWAALSLITYAVDSLSAKHGSSRRLVAIAGGALVVVLSAATHIRADAWSERKVLLQQALVHHPDSRWLRMEMIVDAMGQQPPAVDQARMHADHLMRMSSPLSRRFGAIERVMIDCASGLPASPELLSMMFDGPADPIEADLLLAHQSLGEGIMRQPCDGLSARNMADRLVGMLDRSKLYPGTLGVWRLRFHAAHLYASANQLDQAVIQGKRAIDGGKAQPQVPLFVATVLLEQGELDEAGAMLDIAESTLRSSETLGREQVAEYRGMILKARH